MAIRKYLCAIPLLYSKILKITNYHTVYSWWDSCWTKWRCSCILSHFFSFPLLVIIPPPHKACDSSDWAAHYHVLHPSLELHRWIDIWLLPNYNVVQFRYVVPLGSGTVQTRHSSRWRQHVFLNFVIYRRVSVESKSLRTTASPSPSWKQNLIQFNLDSSIC
jgi:hypothetical protein